MFISPGHLSQEQKNLVLAGFAELFNGRWCILTPNKNTSQVALKKVKFMGTSSKQIATMDAEYHDILAITSHVPI